MKKLSKLSAIAAAIVLGVNSLACPAVVEAADRAAIESYISTLKTYRNKLYVLMRNCKRQNIPTDYEQITYSLIDRWANVYLKEDIENGYYENFDNYIRPTLDNMYNEALQNLNGYLDGTKTAFDVPEYVSSDMEIDGFTVTADTQSLDGEIKRRPVFYTGYGHFEDAAADIPNFQKFGANTIQNEIGLRDVIVNTMAWNITLNGGADAFAKVCRGEHKTGEYSLEISNKSAKQSGVYIDVSQSVTLKPNTDYTLSFAAKAENAGGMQISYNGGTNRFLIDSGTYGWKDYTFSFNSGSITNGQIWILSEDITDKFYLDDISLCESGKTENLLKNGGFENYIPSADNDYYIYAGGIDAAVEMLENAEENNIAVSLLLSPHYFPEFMYEKYPDMRYGEGSFIPHHPKMVEIMSAYIDAVMPRIKDFKSLNNICLTNEPSFRAANYGDFYSLRWIEFLKERYDNSLDRLNKVYNSSYGNWEEIKLKASYQRTAEGYDNKLFSSKVFADWHKFFANRIHGFAPDIPVHAKAQGYLGLHPGFDELLNNSTDFEYFNDFSDIAGCDYSIEYTGVKRGTHQVLGESLWYDYLAGIGEKPVINSEDHVYIDGEENFVPEQAMWMSTNIWQGAVHHRAFSQLWTWRKDYNKNSIYYGSMLFRPDCIAEIGKTNLDLNRLSYEVNALINAPEDVAVLYSSASRHYAPEHMRSVYNAYEASLFNGKKVRVVTESQIEKINGRRALILPNCSNVSKKTLDAIYDFILDGGKVIILGDTSLTKDEYNQAHESGLAEQIKQMSTVVSTTVSGSRVIKPTQKELALKLENYFEANDMQRVLVVDADTGKRVESTEWTSADYDGGLLVNICNYSLNTAKRIKIVVGGTEIESAAELRSGEEIGSEFTINPLEPVLVRIKAPAPAEADNITAAREGENVLLSWTVNDKNVVGAEVYDSDNTYIASAKDNSIAISTAKVRDGVIIRTVSRMGVKSFGRVVVIKNDEIYNIECDAKKVNDTILYSVKANVRGNTAGEAVVRLVDNAGNIVSLVRAELVSGTAELSGSFGNADALCSVEAVIVDSEGTEIAKKTALQSE